MRTTLPAPSPASIPPCTFSLHLQGALNPHVPTLWRRLLGTAFEPFLAAGPPAAAPLSATPLSLAAPLARKKAQNGNKKRVLHGKRLLRYVNISNYR
jgi:hypothetical protein